MRSVSLPSMATRGPVALSTMVRERLSPLFSSSRRVFSSRFSIRGCLSMPRPESKVAEHAKVFLWVASFCGKVIADHHAVRSGREYEALKRAEVNLPPSANDYVFRGEHESYQGYYLKALHRSQIFRSFEGRSRTGVQEVYRHAVNVE